MPTGTRNSQLQVSPQHMPTGTRNSQLQVSPQHMPTGTRNSQFQVSPQHMPTGTRNSQLQVSPQHMPTGTRSSQLQVCTQHMPTRNLKLTLKTRSPNSNYFIAHQRLLYTLQCIWFGYYLLNQVSYNGTSPPLHLFCASYVPPTDLCLCRSPRLDVLFC